MASLTFAGYLDSLKAGRGRTPANLRQYFLCPLCHLLRWAEAGGIDADQKPVALGRHRPQHRLGDHLGNQGHRKSLVPA